MNAAATQDLRSVALTPMLHDAAEGRARRRVPRAARMLALLDAWRAGGSSRLDRDLDGVMDAGAGARDLGRRSTRACSRRRWRRVKGAARRAGEFGAPTPAPRAASPSGGFWYLDKDLRTLNGDEARAARSHALLRRRRRGEVRRGAVGAIRRSARRSRRSRHPRPGRLARRREQGADRVRARACSRPRSATPTARAGSSR